MDETLSGRRIVLGVTGGVAAYKSVELCRELVRRGAEVRPVLTRTAERFIGAATLSAVASQPARTSLWDAPEPSPHTALARWCDMVVVAPATAHFLAAARAGLADDLLGALVLASTAPLIVCPAMHAEMWEHPATVDNLAVLRERGVHIVDPEAGELAGGDVGVGRLAGIGSIVAACEPERVAARRADAPSADARPADAGRRDLEGLTVLVSAGGTREPVDPVRFLGNRSSGKQGHAIASAARSRGARVELVTTQDSARGLGADGIEIEMVETAEEMHEAMALRSMRADIIIMCAAVADYRPVDASRTKLRRSDGPPELALEPTPDILAQLVAARRPGQTIIGFAAETGMAAERGRAKFTGKDVDVLVANDVMAAGSGFEHDTNSVTLFSTARTGPHDVPLTSKQAVANVVLDEVVDVRSATVVPLRSRA